MRLRLWLALCWYALAAPVLVPLLLGLAAWSMFAVGICGVQGATDGSV